MQTSETTRQQIEWQQKFIRWLVPRLAGSDEEKEAAMGIVLAALAEAHASGIDYSADLIDSINAKRPSRDLEVIGKALRELANRNRRDTASGPRR